MQTAKDDLTAIIHGIRINEVGAAFSERLDLRTHQRYPGLGGFENRELVSGFPVGNDRLHDPIMVAWEYRRKGQVLKRLHYMLLHVV